MIHLLLDSFVVPVWTDWLYSISAAAAGVAFISNSMAVFFMYMKRHNFKGSFVIPAFGLSLLACGVVYVLLSFSFFDGIQNIVVVATVILAVVTVPGSALSWIIVLRVVKTTDEPPSNARFGELEKRIDYLAATINRQLDEFTG